MVAGKRLAIHGLIQPDLASEFLGDPVLRGQGLPARFLIGHPSSLVGSRFFRRPPIEVQKLIGDFYRDSLALLQQPWRVRNGNELDFDLMLIPQGSEAERLWIEYYNEIEEKQKWGAPYYDLRDVASKSAEQACRLAGVLTLITDPQLRTIGAEAMVDGLHARTVVSG